MSILTPKKISRKLNFQADSVIDPTSNAIRTLYFIADDLLPRIYKNNVQVPITGISLNGVMSFVKDQATGQMYLRKDYELFTVSPEGEAVLASSLPRFRGSVSFMYDGVFGYTQAKYDTTLGRASTNIFTYVLGERTYQIRRGISPDLKVRLGFGEHKYGVDRVNGFASIEGSEAFDDDYTVNADQEINSTFRLNAATPQGDGSIIEIGLDRSRVQIHTLAEFPFLSATVVTETFNLPELSVDIVTDLNRDFRFTEYNNTDTTFCYVVDVIPEGAVLPTVGVTVGIPAVLTAITIVQDQFVTVLSNNVSQGFLDVIKKGSKQVTIEIETVNISDQTFFQLKQKLLIYGDETYEVLEIESDRKKAILTLRLTNTAVETNPEG